VRNAGGSIPVEALACARLSNKQLLPFHSMFHIVRFQHSAVPLSRRIFVSWRQIRAFPKSHIHALHSDGSRLMRASPQPRAVPAIAAQSMLELDILGPANLLDSA